jgi:hypothetical protein
MTKASWMFQLHRAGAIVRRHDTKPSGKKSTPDSNIFNKEHPLTFESKAGVGKMDREI